MTTRARLCLALDVAEGACARRWVERTRTWVGVYKIGLELFCGEGPAIVDAVRRAGAERVFLDLKLHDIPQTVAGAVRRAAALEVDYLTVHVAGGPEMLDRARAATGERLALLGVTVLTSLDAAALRAVGIEATPRDLALQRARLGRDSGLAGLVCSASEVAELRAEVGPEMKLVTPGLRLPGSESADQRRVAHPVDARRAGADLLVLGRTILEHAAPETALAELSDVLRAAEAPAAGRQP